MEALQRHVMEGCADIVERLGGRGCVIGTLIMQWLEWEAGRAQLPRGLPRIECSLGQVLCLREVSSRPLTARRDLGSCKPSPK